MDAARRELLFTGMFHNLLDCRNFGVQLELQMIVYFTDMALLQLVADWEEIDPDSIDIAEYELLVRRREKMLARKVVSGQPPPTTPKARDIGAVTSNLGES